MSENTIIRNRLRILESSRVHVREEPSPGLLIIIPRIAYKNETDNLKLKLAVVPMNLPSRALQRDSSAESEVCGSRARYRGSSRRRGHENTPATGTCPAPLVTTCVAPMPLTPDHVSSSQEMIKTIEGPYNPGIATQRTLLAPFTIVVSYRHYRLRDTRATLHVTESESVYRVKRRFDALFPSFQPFDGTNPIKLL